MYGCLCWIGIGICTRKHKGEASRAGHGKQPPMQCEEVSRKQTMYLCSHQRHAGSVHYKVLLENWLGWLPIAPSALCTHTHGTASREPHRRPTSQAKQVSKLMASMTYTHGLHMISRCRICLCSALPTLPALPPLPTHWLRLHYTDRLHREHVRAATTVHAHITPDLHHDIRADHDALCRRWKSTARPAHAHLTSRLSYCSPGRAVIGLTSSVSPSRRPGKRRASSTTTR
jgi:hypothetical protein